MNKRALIIIVLIVFLFAAVSVVALTRLPKEPQSEPESAPLLQESDLSAMESVTYLDFDETWYKIEGGAPEFSQVLSTLRQLEGSSIPPFEDTPAGWYTFSLEYSGASHPLNLTSTGENQFYADLDGALYEVTVDCGAELAEFLRENGKRIPKEVWKKTAGG